MKRKPPLEGPLIATPTSQGRKEQGVERKIETSNLKTLTPCWLPTNFIRANPLHSQRVNNGHKPIKRVFFPILWCTTKLKIPMNPPTSPTHNLQHQGVPCPTKAKKTQKSFFKGTIPTPHMLPNFTLVPSPTSYCKSLEKFNQPLLINLQRLTPYALVTFFMHQPPQSFPYFASITLLHNAFVSNPYLHNHLPNKAELKLLNHLIPSPPTCIGLQTLAYFTMCNLESPLIPLQRKSLYNFSMRLATFPSTGSMERK